MRNKDYWKKRSEQIVSKQFKKTDEHVNSMIKEYEKAKISIERDIEVFYQRFAIENKVDMSEAKKLLGGRELSEFKMTLEEFTSKAKNNINNIWEQELNNVSYKVRVSRLEALQTQIQHQVEILMNNQLEGMNRLLSDIYENTYYRNIYEFQKGLGIGVNFAKLDTNTIERAINQKWLEDNFSSRIWTNRSKLISELQTNLVQSFIRGDSIDKTSRLLMDRMNVSRSRAATLVNTESAYITNKATMDSYKNSGVVKEYEVLSTLDTRTSQICRSMDGKIFKVSEMQSGVNAPPFHPNCRTTTVSYFPDTIDEGRIARDSDGNVYYVDGNIKYEQWYNEYVKSNPKELVQENKIHNRYSDKKQYEKYKEILGEQIPKSFDKFQKLKYNNSEEWEALKSQFKSKISKTKRDGATRAEEFSKYWQESSLKDTINRHIPDYQVEEKRDKGKIIYSSNQSNLQIVYDINGDYFRIEDTSKKGKRRYLDINANDVSNKIENGKQKGRSKDEYEALTHYKNNDKKGDEK